MTTVLNELPKGSTKSLKCTAGKIPYAAPVSLRLRKGRTKKILNQVFVARTVVLLVINFSQTHLIPSSTLNKKQHNQTVISSTLLINILNTQPVRHSFVIKLQWLQITPKYQTRSKVEANQMFRINAVVLYVIVITPKTLYLASWLSSSRHQCTSCNAYRVYLWFPSTSPAHFCHWRQTWLWALAGESSLRDG